MAYKRCYLYWRNVFSVLQSKDLAIKIVCVGSAQL